MQDIPALDDPDDWTAVVQAANPAALLVEIQSRMGPVLAQRTSAEDILQEALLRAWRHRTTVVWQGAPAFRRWLLTIAESTIEDHRDHFRAQKRDVDRTRSLTGADSADAIEPWSSTTPDRIASERERARTMATALASLPDDVREVVELRLFHELSIAEIAARLAIGESAVRHRFRKGAEAYALRLKALQSASSHDGRPGTGTA